MALHAQSTSDVQHFTVRTTGNPLSYLPARRAGRIDPQSALRHE